MTQGRFKFRSPDFWPLAHLPPLLRWGLSQTTLDMEVTSMSQALPYFTLSSPSSVWLPVAIGQVEFADEGLWRLSLGGRPWGQCLAWGIPWTGGGGLGKTRRCSFLTCSQKTGLILDTWWQVQNVSKWDLGLISYEMDSTYYIASNSPLIYCPVRLVFSERGGGGKTRNCSLSQDFFYHRCLQLAISAFSSVCALE